MSTSLWRNRHDRSKTDKSLDTVQFSVREGIVGVDWEVEAEPGESLSWEEYERRAETVDYTDDEAWVRSLRAIHEHMDENDLCYTRDASGQFYLGRVTGPWRYEADPEYERHALVNVRDCDWYRIRDPEETIPTELLKSFGRGSVLQRVKDLRLLAFSQRLYEVMDDREHYDIDLPYTLDNWLSDDDLRDLLALKLQVNENQLLLPSTVDQKPFLPQGITVNRLSGDRTLYQVQHHHDELPPGAYENDERRVIYLQREEEPRPDLPGNVEVLPLENLTTVFEDHWELLPRRLRIIGDVLLEKGTLGDTKPSSPPTNEETETEEEPSRKPVGGTTRSVLYFIAGLLLGLSSILTYGLWTGPAETTYSQQQRALLQQKVSTLRSSHKAAITERNELRQELAALKQANESNEQNDLNWVSVRVLRNDTLSELLARFQGSQRQQDEVVERNNLRDRDLIYTGSTLSFPTQSRTETDQMAQK